jgi:hypothetical protein
MSNNISYIEDYILPGYGSEGVSNTLLVEAENQNEQPKNVSLVFDYLLEELDIIRNEIELEINRIEHNLSNNCTPDLHFIFTKLADQDKLLEEIKSTKQHFNNEINSKS